MADDEFYAQCWGGPKHGEPVSAKQTRWLYHSTVLLFLDGEEAPPTVDHTYGLYIYTVRHGQSGQPIYIWEWKGPGADGDTMERLRKS